MAQIQLKHPEPFNFKQPDDWYRWKRRFDQFRSASGLEGESEAKQISTLLYCMGDEAEMVLSSTGITDAQRRTYRTVCEKLDGFFKVRRNVIFERARFNKRNQLPGEPAERYIMELYNLIENCKYGDLAPEMMRDRLVVGIRDEALSEKLQLDPELTLEKAKKMIRQREAVHEQLQTLKEEPDKAMDAMSAGPGNSRRQKNGQQRQCMRCGKGQHPRDRCPAKEALCHRCQRKGHYSAQCRSRTVAGVSGRDQEDDTNTGANADADSVFLGDVSSCQERSWKAKLQLNGTECAFKLDTGAEVTAISDQTYEAMNKKVPLTTPRKKLFGPAHVALEVMGQFDGMLVFQGKTSKQAVYVVKNLKTNLLGLPAITSLHLVARLDATSMCEVQEEFPTVFEGLGNLGEPYHIQLQPDAKPYALFTPRNIPLPLRPKVELELQRMEKLGVISKVDVPTPWCAGMVAVPKKNKSVRICVDLQPLNKSVLREVHPLPRVDEILAQLSGAKVFSKLDANSGFWQIPLTDESKLLTTFVTPYGRFCFNKLPFGISSAPEVFQKRMSQILDGLDGVLCLIDDVVVFGKDKEEHDRRLRAALRRILEAGATLNKDKCEFAKTKILFLGHVIDHNGIRADPEKTAAIQEMIRPGNVTELRRFLGMVTQMGKFSRNLAELTQPLRELLGKDRAWRWNPAQEEAFSSVKEELCKPTILSLYDPNAATKISADASSHGLGAVLLQEHGSSWKPVAYASRSMSKTEKRYAQVEKEALAITWACDKFATYIIGMKILIETDHKPLIPLLGSKHLDDLPPRILRFRLRLARVDYSIIHVPGKLLYTADTLSRAPRSTISNDADLEEDVECMMEVTVNNLPASQQRLEEYIKAQATDPVCSLVSRYCCQGWPAKEKIEPHLKPFWKERGDLTINKDLLLYGQRIVVPKSLQKETLLKIHEGHQGIQRCRLRARCSVWWPGMSTQIKDLVESCSTCVRNRAPHHEPLISTPLPEYPWQKIASDLFYLDGCDYLMVTDYFSRYPEVIKLRSTTSSGIIEALKAIFSRHGIPQILISDNGPQYSSEEFTKFASRYNFLHITSSPYFPQSNGCAERAVQTVKTLLKESTDPHLSLLTYRTTPLPWCGLSPAELLMGRKLRASLPVVVERLTPSWPYLDGFRQHDADFKHKQKKDYDRRHRARPLPPIPDSSDVWITSGEEPVPGRVSGESVTPRSYNVVPTQGGVVRRNRYHLNVFPEDSQSDSSANQDPDPEISVSPPRQIMTRSRTGTAIHPPDRL